MLQDRVVRGFTAGIIAGVVMNVISILSYYLNIANLRFLDWPSIIITGRIPNNTLEAAFGLIVQLIFVGFLGVIFTFLISGLSSERNHLFKGWLFGVIAWFAIYAFTYVANVPKLTPLTINTALTDFIGASLFGIVLAEALNRMDIKQA